MTWSLITILGKRMLWQMLWAENLLLPWLTSVLVTSQIRECDRLVANKYLCLWSFDLLVTYWNSDMTSSVQGVCRTCKTCNPPTMIHHTTSTQMVSIINYIYIISKCIQNYRLSIEYLCDVWYKKTKHDKKRQHMISLDDCARLFHKATDLMSKVHRAHRWMDVS